MGSWMRHRRGLRYLSYLEMNERYEGDLMGGLHGLSTWKMRIVYSRRGVGVVQSVAE